MPDPESHKGGFMTKRVLGVIVICLAFFAGVKCWNAAQRESTPVFRAEVNMVELDVAVTDKKGNYITGLSPWDFQIYEDGIAQKIATFGEQNEVPRSLDDYARERTTAIGEAPPSGTGRRVRKVAPSPITQNASPDGVAALVAGASVFILFDTSNYMYRGFVYAQDAITQFVRSLNHPNRVALYSYSRNFSRVCTLTPDSTMALVAVRKTVAGDDAAVYDALLMTLKDASRYTGRRVIVVFSNGPDNASMVAPEDVREVAQTEGIPIYMISTHLARLDPVSTAVFERMSASTGGKSYFAKDWQDQERAFASIRDDLAHLYTLTYYPQPNPNHGWRSLSVKLVGPSLRDYRVRTRSGYRPRITSHYVQAAATP